MLSTLKVKLKNVKIYNLYKKISMQLKVGRIRDVLNIKFNYMERGKSSEIW